jgi:hypothetical protein
MPKGVRKNAEDIVKGILEKQKERIRKIQERDRAKIKKLNSLLAKEKQTRQAEAGAAIEKLYREQLAALDIKKVLAVCEKYWPLSPILESSPKEPKETLEKGKQA